MFHKILIAGLDDPPGGDLRQLLLDAIPDTYVVFFMDKRHYAGVLGHVDLVVVCHPEILRTMFGASKVADLDKGWWSKDFKCWFYRTNRYELASDMESFKQTLDLMKTFVPTEG